MWIERRLKEVPALRVIVTVPLKPEEKDPLLSPHGNWLQHRNIVRLYTAGTQGRFGAFNLRVRAGKGLGGMLYVHSKVMIVDDECAIIGSANANPRSFRLDSEANLAWQQRSSVRAFRLELWKPLLGAPADLRLVEAGGVR